MWCDIVSIIILQKEATGLASLGFMYLKGLGVEKVYSDCNFNITVHVQAFAGVTYVHLHLLLLGHQQSLYVHQSVGQQWVGGWSCADGRTAVE